ncbi:hypothetical protein AGLY_006740 [Aphis glycines]|uniref:Uncharacterized protein n=1 Tax=Aphis glycines TaxID=307491 RepID=A0A6G0TQ49_APHGL|nr:hypothetical protein AGLY_006740 [Aphis glycines]
MILDVKKLIVCVSCCEFYRNLEYWYDNEDSERSDECIDFTMILTNHLRSESFLSVIQINFKASKHSIEHFSESFTLKPLLADLFSISYKMFRPQNFAGLDVNTALLWKTNKTIKPKKLKATFMYLAITYKYKHKTTYMKGFNKCLEVQVLQKCVLCNNTLDYLVTVILELENKFLKVHKGHTRTYYMKAGLFLFATNVDSYVIPITATNTIIKFLHCMVIVVTIEGC